MQIFHPFLWSFNLIAYILLFHLCLCYDEVHLGIEFAWNCPRNNRKIASLWQLSTPSLMQLSDSDQHFQGPAIVFFFFFLLPLFVSFLIIQIRFLFTPAIVALLERPVISTVRSIPISTSNRFRAFIHRLIMFVILTCSAEY